MTNDFPVLLSGAPLPRKKSAKALKTIMKSFRQMSNKKDGCYTGSFVLLQSVQIIFFFGREQ